MSADGSQTLRSVIPNARFGAPCTATDIDWAEKRVGLTFPSSLREVYLQCNGFRNYLNIQYLFPLISPAPEIDSDETAVRFTLFTRSEAEFNRQTTGKCFFFGGPGNGDWWGIHADHPGSIVLWNPRWDNEDPPYRIAGENLITVWLNEERRIAEALSNQAHK